MKTKQPICVLLTDATMLDWPVFKKMIASGDLVSAIEMGSGVDVIYGSLAHYLTFEMQPYVASANKRVREKRYGKTPRATKPRKSKAVRDQTGSEDESDAGGDA